MDVNVLTTVLSTFVNALATGLHSVQSGAGGIMKSLAAIEIVLCGFWIAVDGGERLSTVCRFLLQLTFWMFFAANFASFAKLFSDTLIQYGLSASGQGANVSLLLDPSRIAGMAFDATQPLIQSMDDAGLTHLKDAIILGLCYLLIMASFFAIACQICLAVVEYYLIVTLSTCLVPFGISKHTRFIAEKAIGAVVAVSVKLMVLGFVVGLIQPVLSQLRFSGGGEIKLNEVMSMILVCGLLAVVVWRAPGFAADLLAAAPSLSAAAVGQHVTGAISNATRAATGALAGGVGATRSAATLVRAGATGTGGAFRMVGSAIARGWQAGTADVAASADRDAAGALGSRVVPHSKAASKTRSPPSQPT
jgi:type IV secretion system protein TrbL